MAHPPLADLPPTDRVLYRAQGEAFAFSLLGGDIRVRNESHPEPGNHEYRVSVVDGLPVACTCPADAAYDGPCKHRVAVAIRSVLLDVATSTSLGGTTSSSSATW